ncbi:transcription repressor OFP8-like [Cucurbita pepo subsp. pepo]|uniref:transcription repressor OFP8-like n=1 Tax=Cucurbita pepo subsp. pepo TaxID=3664 RepID=UPI000C9D7DE9|nr:transcription repressor OFP8-like [Cucurbita pepo subsp. pepo]
MERRLKLRFSRIFQSSFFSCRSKKNSDIIITNQPIPISAPLQNLPLLPSKPTNISSKPPLFPPNSFLAPPASPISPPLSHLKDCLSRHKPKPKPKPKPKNSTKTNRKKYPTRPTTAPTTEDFGGAWWYGGDDETEDETETLFSSRSLTSNSSVSRLRRRRHSRRKSEKKVKDGFFAVVQNSSDPYKDFKASMAEMVVEREIFGGKELEELLLCFISLNSRHYHRIIFEVYWEIKEALFFSDLGFKN